MARRIAGVLLVTAAMLLPLAAAQAAPDAPAVPATPLSRTLADAASAARDDITSTASSAAASLAAAGSALAEAAANAAAALVGLLSAAGAAIAAGLAAVVSALALFAGASYDFARAHPKETAIAAGSVTAAAGIGALLKRFGALLFLPLYTRLAPSEMLDNAARNSVYEHVRANPGAHPSAIATALRLGWGTTVYHLGRLEDSKLVVSRSAHNRKCYFVVGSELDADARGAVAAMAHEKAKLIVHAVRAAPGISQKTLAETLGMSQALASWHVKRLVESGVLRSERVGRSHALHVREHVPASAPPAPASVAVAA